MIKNMDKEIPGAVKEVSYEIDDDKLLITKGAAGVAINEEKLENLIKAIDDLKEKIGIKKTIKEYGVDEKYFLDNLDEMSKQAFDDQCTGSNPRYPLISEIKDMYLILI